MGKPGPLTPLQTWSGWAARAARFIDNADARHPDLKGLAPDDRAAISRRLHDASKGR